MSLKEELINKIAATEDENLLQLIKADLEYFSGEGKEDITDELTPSQLEELLKVMNS